MMLVVFKEGDRSIVCDSCGKTVRQAIGFDSDLVCSDCLHEAVVKIEESAQENAKDWLSPETERTT